jgi:hypothetical protein
VSGGTSTLTALRVSDALDRQWDNPSNDVIWDLVSGLTVSDNYFVLVEHLPDTSAGGTYIQTAILEDECYTVEYQDGDVEHHFHADSTAPAKSTKSSWPGRLSVPAGGRCWHLLAVAGGVVTVTRATWRC